jgi:hypothetical protein
MSINEIYVFISYFDSWMVLEQLENTFISFQRKSESIQLILNFKIFQYII